MITTHYAHRYWESFDQDRDLNCFIATPERADLTVIEYDARGLAAFQWIIAEERERNRDAE